LDQSKEPDGIKPRETDHERSAARRRYADEQCFFRSDHELDVRDLGPGNKIARAQSYLRTNSLGHDRDLRGCTHLPKDPDREEYGHKSLKDDEPAHNAIDQRKNAQRDNRGKHDQWNDEPPGQGRPLEMEGDFISISCLQSLLAFLLKLPKVIVKAVLIREE
jgi:hypothetical protein